MVYTKIFPRCEGSASIWSEVPCVAELLFTHEHSSKASVLIVYHIAGKLMGF